MTEYGMSDVNGMGREDIRGGGRLRAVIYLRVSTSKQAERLGDSEGYSLPAQRDACHRKATDLGADVVDEYIDRGESAKYENRAQFQAMVGRVIEQHDVDVVIFHKLDRFARSVRDDANTFFRLRAAGAQLVSVSENIDETPQGMLVHWIMAAMAEFYSANLASEVKKGSLQKAKAGGTPFRAPLGYLNVQERIGGRSAAMVVLDPDRAPLIREAFELYATGDYTLRQLLDHLSAKGLTSRAFGDRPVRPLSLSKFATLLRKRYYLGVVVYQGVEYEGRHSRLVDDSTFERVQELMDSRIKSGEKQRLNQHYLKGSLVCGRCGSRMSLIMANGRNQIYPYFYCLGRQRRNGCDLPYLDIDRVEAKVEALYAAVELTSAETDALKAEISRQLDAVAETSVTERKLLDRQITKLDIERRRWAEKVIVGSVPDDIGREKQATLARQLSAARKALAAHVATAPDVAETVSKALDLVANCFSTYVGAAPHIRRQWNHAFFSRIMVDADGPARADVSPAFSALRSIHQPGGRKRKNRDPVLPGPGSSENRLVGEGGLEPPHPFGHRNLNPARLPIPPLARATGRGYPMNETARSLGNAGSGALG